MFLDDWILPILIGILSTYLIMSILYYNKTYNKHIQDKYYHKKLHHMYRDKFSDLGAQIQLATSRPIQYLYYIPENTTVMNSINKNMNTVSHINNNVRVNI